MEQIVSSISGDGDRTLKLNNRQELGPGTTSQGLPSHPPLSCPRCDSTNTKFCYYNNYNQAQPRHFCKSCRRYWTQGGTLRNVPIGGGCRKNRHVRPRSLNGRDHWPTAFTDTISSNMLGRLSSNGCEDASNHLLSIAFARFQESLRLRQQAPQITERPPFSSDMSLPALIHKPSEISSIRPPRTLLGLDHPHCGGLAVNGFENNLSFQALQADPRYHRSIYEMPNPPLQAHSHDLMATSATATLDSLQEELSSFSNLQYYVNPVNTDVDHVNRVFHLPACSAPQRLPARPSMEQQAESDLSYVASTADAHLSGPNAEDKMINEDIKPVISMSGAASISLMKPADNNWMLQQQPASVSEIPINEPIHGITWPTNTTRWQQDMYTASVL